MHELDLGVALAAHLDHAFGQVAGDDLGAALGQRRRRRAGAGRHVEDAFAGVRGDGLAQGGHPHPV